MQYGIRFMLEVQLGVHEVTYGTTRNIDGMHLVGKKSVMKIYDSDYENM